MGKKGFRILLLLVMLIFLIVSCVGGFGLIRVNQNQDRVGVEEIDPNVYRLTATYGAEQFEIQLTAVAEQNIK